MNRLECAGNLLEERDGKWFVDGEELPDAEYAFEVWASRIYGSSQELPRAIISYIRRYTGWQLASPGTMVRRARDRTGLSQRALAKLAEVDHTSVSRIERHAMNPSAKLLFKILHAAHTR